VTVVDGQQRLATVSILLACIRNALAEVGDLRANTLTTTFLATDDFRSAARVARLQLNEEDASFFVQNIVDLAPENLKPHGASDYKSNQLLLGARDTLTKLLQLEIDAAGSNWATRLIRWIEFLQNGVRVISLQVESEADAFLIFETLNDRGLGLTIADLLENHLLSSARARIKTDGVHAAWMSIVRAFPPADGDDDSESDDVITTFIRHYWSSLHGPTRERALYSSLKRRIRSPEQASDLVATSQTAHRPTQHYLMLTTTSGRNSVLIQLSGIPSYVSVSSSRVHYSLQLSTYSR